MRRREMPVAPMRLSAKSESPPNVPRPSMTTSLLQNRLRGEGAVTEESSEQKPTRGEEGTKRGQQAQMRAHAKPRETGWDDIQIDAPSRSGGGGGREAQLQQQSLVRRNSALILELMKLRESNDRLRKELKASQLSLMLARHPHIDINVNVTQPTTAAAGTQTDDNVMEAKTPLSISAAVKQDAAPCVKTTTTCEQGSQTMRGLTRAVTSKSCWGHVNVNAHDVDGNNESSDSSINFNLHVPQTTPKKVSMKNVSSQSSPIRAFGDDENRINIDPKRFGASVSQPSDEDPWGGGSSPSYSPRSPRSPFAPLDDAFAAPPLSDTDVESVETPSTTTRLNDFAVALADAKAAVAYASPTMQHNLGVQAKRLKNSASEVKVPKSRDANNYNSQTPLSKIKIVTTSPKSNADKSSQNIGSSEEPSPFSPLPLSAEWLSPVYTHQRKLARKRRSQMVVKQDSLQLLLAGGGKSDAETNKDGQRKSSASPRLDRTG